MAALAATSAFAQSSVSISGNADVAYATKEAIGATGTSFLKTTGIGDGAMVPNRIILTVKEDLGGGMTASFVNEHGVSPTATTDWSSRTANGAPALNGTSTAANAAGNVLPGAGALSTGTNRGTYVGLAGKFGEVRAGYLVNDSYNLSSQSGYLLGMEQYGGLAHTAGQAETGGARGNGVQYISPVVNGFKASIQMGSGDQRELTESSAVNNGYTKNKESRTGLRVDYASGPLNVAYARTNFTNLKEGASGNVTTIYGATAAAANKDQKNTLDQLVGAYTFGAFKAIATYNKATVDDATNTSDRDIKSKTYGLQYTTGPWTVYGMGGTETRVKVSDGSTQNDIKQKQFAVKYAFSKRTTGYLMTGESKDTGAAMTAADHIAKGKVTALGLAHAF